VEHYENYNDDNFLMDQNPASSNVLGLKPQEVSGALTALDPGDWLTEDNVVAETTFWTDGGTTSKHSLEPRRASSARPELFTIARQYRTSCAVGAGNYDLVRLINFLSVICALARRAPSSSRSTSTPTTGRPPLSSPPTARSISLTA